MKAILKFNLPEENESFLQAAQALDAFRALSEFRSWLRVQIKYGDNQQTDYESIKEKFEEIIPESIWSLI